MIHQADPFADLEQRIEATFQEETALARAKRDKGLELLHSLRDGWGTTIDETSREEPEELKEGGEAEKSGADETDATVSPSGISLKRAMVEAIHSMPASVSRGRVLSYVFEKYPALAASKEGTIASTFSRVKAAYLEVVDGNEKFVFRLKETAPANGHTVERIHRAN